jgi:hypothetical protein
MARSFSKWLVLGFRSFVCATDRLCVIDGVWDLRVTGVIPVEYRVCNRLREFWLLVDVEDVDEVVDLVALRLIDIVGN